jgi:ABC-type Fe3+-hydroxamate transport system substrate-binding protein
LRVVSLVPSATETLLAWNVEPIGVTRFCEQGNRFATFGGTKDPHLDLIVAASPDLVVMCDQENRKEDAAVLTAEGLRVHVVHITRLEHVGPEMIRLSEVLELDRALGESCDASNDNDALGQCEDDLDQPAGLKPARIEAVGQKPLKVFVPIWRKPWMTINNDTYGGSILEGAGFANVFGAHADRYPTVSPEEIVANQPEVVLAPSEPYPFTERQRGELEVFAPPRFVDGKDLFWWGARTPSALARIRELHQDKQQQEQQ